MPSESRCATGRLGLQPLCVGFPQDFPSFAVQPDADLLKGIQLQVLLPPLYGAVVGPVHPNKVREPFLAVACRQAAVAQCFTKLLQ